MIAPQVPVQALRPAAPRRNTLRAAKTSPLRLSSEARAALRLAAAAAEKSTTNHVRLAPLWRELARGSTGIVDGFFTEERCYLILRSRRDAAAPAIEGRRLDILEAVLAGSRQKNIAMDLKVAPSTVALNSRLALEALGVPGKPSRAHPLLMLMARAAALPVVPQARSATFVVQDDCELRVVGLPRPDLRLAEVLPSAELAVIRHLIEGHSYREIARLRSTSTRTVANQISAVFRRLRVSGRNELVQRLFREERSGSAFPVPNETIAPPGLGVSATRPTGPARRIA